MRTLSKTRSLLALVLTLALTAALAAPAMAMPFDQTSPLSLSEQIGSWFQSVMSLIAPSGGTADPDGQAPSGGTADPDGNGPTESSSSAPGALGGDSGGTADPDGGAA